mmetsp:Transcript_16447/g.31168  ORF Transcript_16447/g.31168 Transcript_16447/m.31168 type:complete len:587 (-) Transcript_16447:1657-3417(-)
MKLIDMKNLIYLLAMLRVARFSTTSLNVFAFTANCPSRQQAREVCLRASSNDDEMVKRYVVIQKNKQSMNFRNGSPLVFSGSVEKTIQVQTIVSKESEGQIPMGSLVGILVEDDNHETQSKKNTNRNSGGRKKRSQEKAAADIRYKHYVVDENFNVAKEYNADGDFLSHNENALEIKRSLQQGKLIGFGFFNPISMYRTFIFCHESNFKDVFKDVNDIFKTTTKGYGERTNEIIEMVMRTKIKDAIRSRMLLNLPSSSTNSYRLINGEGDGLSGLAVDILGGKVAVMMASAAWVEIHKPVIVKVMREVLDTHPLYGGAENNRLDIVWRNTPMRLRQDGYELPDEYSDVEKEELDATPVILTENNINYYAYPYDTSSQKTGFYCDQRENRYNLSTHCENKKVLDLCCFNGGFALNAMIHGGASSCVGVDSSQQAVDAATANARLNNLDPDRIEFIRQDISEYMKGAKDKGEEFDVIILDPPKLAPTVTALDRASRKYHSLNRDAMKLINSKEGGLLLTCTCSGAMTQKNGGQYFLETIKKAALSAGRRITLLRSNGAAPCHTQCPASFPANAYLTAALFYVSPENDD